MMPYTESAHGVWYPKSGKYRVVEARGQRILCTIGGQDVQRYNVVLQ